MLPAVLLARLNAIELGLVVLEIGQNAFQFGLSLVNSSAEPHSLQLLRFARELPAIGQMPPFAAASAKSCTSPAST